MQLENRLKLCGFERGSLLRGYIQIAAKRGKSRQG
jgi:hypothetical protein